MRRSACYAERRQPTIGVASMCLWDACAGRFPVLRFSAASQKLTCPFLVILGLVSTRTGPPKRPCRFHFRPPSPLRQQCLLPMSDLTGTYSPFGAAWRRSFHPFSESALTLCGENENGRRYGALGEGHLRMYSGTPSSSSSVRRWSMEATATA